jgi:hypothetical protein
VIRTSYVIDVTKKAIPQKVVRPVPGSQTFTVMATAGKLYF